MTAYGGKVTGAGGKGFSSEITIEGYEDTVAALRSLEPDVLKRMNKEIRAAINKVKAAAVASGPSGHPLKYTVRMTARGKKAGTRLMAADKETSIFEFAGTKGKSRTGGPITPQGSAMVRWLDGFGKPGRFMWKAWDDGAAAFETDLKSAVADAEQELQGHLNAAGEVY